MHREKKEKSVKLVKIKVEGENEDEQQHGPSQNVGWIKEEPLNYSDGLEPCVNNFRDHSSPDVKLETSRIIKSEEDTEDDIPLVGVLVVELWGEYSAPVFCSHSLCCM